jgi:hypothetical protein
LEEIYKYIQWDLDLGEETKQKSRMEQLRHDIPIYMEAYRFKDYWRSIEGEIQRQFEITEQKKREEAMKKTI